MTLQLQTACNSERRSSRDIHDLDLALEYLSHRLVTINAAFGVKAYSSEFGVKSCNSESGVKLRNFDSRKDSETVPNWQALLLFLM